MSNFPEKREFFENLRNDLKNHTVSVKVIIHTTYRRNNIMRQKCGGDCGLWILNEIIKEKYPENMKKIVGAVWELPAK